MPNPITDVSPDTLALVDCLAAASVGAVVGWPALDAAIGRPVQQHRHLLMSALRIVLREHGAAFASVRGVGYRRLAPEEAGKIGAFARGAIRRKAHRAGKSMRQAVSRANDLPAGSLSAVYREISVLGVIEHFARDTTQAAITAENKPVPVAIAASQFLAAMKRKPG